MDDAIDLDLIPPCYAPSVLLVLVDHNWYLGGGKVGVYCSVTFRLMCLHVVVMSVPLSSKTSVYLQYK
jgi:hypothetical protein